MPAMPMPNGADSRKMTFAFPVSAVGMIDDLIEYTLPMNTLFRIPTLLLSLLMLMAPLSPVPADDDYVEARRLKESGDILPLQTILDRLQHSHPGKVLEVELETKRQSIYYEVEILDDRGVVHEIYVNARNGEIIKEKRED
jgi:hypothetical protein